jgi:hypothetical protein
MKPTTKTFKDATEAARWLDSQGVEIIIGFPRQFVTPYPNYYEGTILKKFAGSRLKRYVLRVIADATRADWDAQVERLGVEDHNPKDDGTQTFFRCRLENCPEA